MIIFMALYWVLMESVELRQAPWTLWIQDLTARDPYFILPVLNIAIMWSTQKLTPMSGMDPMQQKRSEEHTSELQSLMRISYAVFCLKKKKKKIKQHTQVLNI